ncbi:MAG: hypothetical protein KFH87_05480, partial [Bacteroidetes bacterium]|nr:hypothetical protein [Bacteroidota bacterium]
MILRYFFILTILVALPPSLPGQQPVAGDDTLFFALPEHVTVTATRIPTALQNAPAGTDLFTAETIDALPAISLSDILSLATG